MPRATGKRKCACSDLLFRSRTCRMQSFWSVLLRDCWPFSKIFVDSKTGRQTFYEKAPDRSILVIPHCEMIHIQTNMAWFVLKYRSESIIQMSKYVVFFSRSSYWYFDVVLLKWHAVLVIVSCTKGLGTSRNTFAPDMQLSQLPWCLLSRASVKGKIMIIRSMRSELF